MGRAKRPRKEESSLMPILRQLGEEGLPEGFAQFWYGSGGEISEAARRLESAPPIKDQEKLDALDALANLVWQASSQATGEEVQIRAHYHEARALGHEPHVQIAAHLIEQDVGREAFQAYRLWRESLPPEILDDVVEACRRSGRELAVIWAAAATGRAVGKNNVLRDIFPETRFAHFSTEEVLSVLEDALRPISLIARGDRETLTHSPKDAQWSLVY